MGEKIKSAVVSVQELAVGLFSWTILAAIAVIISGKLVVKRLPIGLADDAVFSLPLIWFKIKATGDEVSVGFLLFITTLGVDVILGGKSVYDFFRVQSGIDIGQWNSLCVVSCFFSLVFSAIICILVPFIKPSPLVTDSEREEVNKKLRGE